MSRVSIFDSPFLLGFDHLERMLDHVARNTNDGYPPYNIEQISDSHLRIVIAVAGFSMDDLSVSLEQNQLIIRGKKQNGAEDDKEKIFIHRGIATRQFQRSFVLSDEIEIEDATMDNGLLYINLKRIVPETLVRKIEIRDNKSANGKGKTIDVEKSD